MTIAQQYGHLIGAFVRMCGGPDKFAHTYVGMTGWLLIGLALRRPLRSPAPLLAVLALEIANETMDWIVQGYVAWPDTLGDVAATLFWPAVLMIRAQMMHRRAVAVQIAGRP